MNAAGDGFQQFENDAGDIAGGFSLHLMDERQSGFTLGD